MTKRRPMTEAEWLASVQPGLMLQYLQQHRLVTRAPGGRRRLRLFACACCRSVWDHLDEWDRRAVEVSERYADRKGSRRELEGVREGAEAAERAARQQLSEARRLGSEGVAPREALLWEQAASAARWATQTLHAVWAAELAAMSAQAVRGALADETSSPGPGYAASLRAEARFQAGLVRDLFGNPFRPVPAADTAWLAWNSGTVPKLAQAVHDERAFDRMPVLADALEEAGCTDPGILSHCRSGGPHARGCWVIDLLLGIA